MIEARRLTKRFGRKVAVDEVTFTVTPGEVLGFLGPNAAGKSTTMRMITGFLPPTSGTAVIGGDDICENSLAARAKIGYLPENAPVYPDMTVLGFLDFIAEVRGFSGMARSERVRETLERCFLTEVRHQSISTLSKGFKQRVCFAQSILHDPPYLIMDEPTDGLDPNQKHEMRDMIRDMAREKTILLSTHNLEEVDAVCTRVIIISGGRIVADETPEALRRHSSIHGAVRIRVSDGDGERLTGLLAGVEGVGAVKLIEQVEGLTTLRLYPGEGDRSTLSETIVRGVLDLNLPLRALEVEKGRLDEVFRLITTGDSGEQTP